MSLIVPWDFTSVPDTKVDTTGLESFDKTIITQGNDKSNQCSYFNPVTISIENGVYYVSIYLCKLTEDEDLSQQFAIWLASLKENDIVKLTVSSELMFTPPSMFITILSALANTKATLKMMLDQVVFDNIGYIYLLGKEVIVGSCGAILLPSYVDQRKEDKSAPWKAIHDFYKWIVKDSVKKGWLTEEEANRLDSGSTVIIPPSRFII